MMNFTDNIRPEAVRTRNENIARCAHRMNWVVALRTGRIEPAPCADCAADDAALVSSRSHT